MILTILTITITVLISQNTVLSEDVGRLTKRYNFVYMIYFLSVLIICCTVMNFGSLLHELPTEARRALRNIESTSRKITNATLFVWKDQGDFCCSSGFQRWFIYFTVPLHRRIF